MFTLPFGVLLSPLLLGAGRTIGQSGTTSDYKKRNYYMVDHADFLLAVYDNNRKLRSGTGQTVNYALKQNLRIIFLHPDTAEIS